METFCVDLLGCIKCYQCALDEKEGVSKGYFCDYNY